MARVVLKLKTYIANVLELFQVQEPKKGWGEVGFKSICSVWQCARIGLCPAVTKSKKTLVFLFLGLLPSRWPKLC